MVELLKEIEDLPATYPELQDMQNNLWMGNGLTGDTIWQRIEAYTAHRWTPRGVIWLVEGPGEWTPRLTPATITLTERWGAAAWQPVDLRPAPLGGFDLDAHGPYRITATVGGGDVPQAVHQAFRRLGEYMAAAQDTAGAAKVDRQEGELGITIERNPAWLARAMQYSGAADLLRPYRRA